MDDSKHRTDSPATIARRARQNVRRRAEAAMRGRVPKSERTRVWRGLNAGLRQF